MALAVPWPFDTGLSQALDWLQLAQSCKSGVGSCQRNSSGRGWGGPTWNTLSLSFNPFRIPSLLIEHGLGQTQQESLNLSRQ